MTSEDHLSTPMLTTEDNPYDPFVDFKQWFMFDVEHHYNTCGLLSDLAHTSDSLSDEENEVELEIACNEVIRLHPEGFYKKVYAKELA